MKCFRAYTIFMELVGFSRGATLPKSGHISRIVTWLILFSYLFMFTGNIVETSCCQNLEIAGFSDHLDHEHASSRIIALAHKFLHKYESGIADFVMSRHCCGISAGQEEQALPPHSIVRVFSGRDLECPTEVPCLENLSASVRSCKFSNNETNLESNPPSVLASIKSIVLII
jgi:hypothetical protein